MNEKDDEQLIHYVRRIHEETQQFSLDLLTENEKLRALMAALKNENMKLEEQLLLAHQKMDRHAGEQAHLQKQIAEIQAENQYFSNKYIELEHHNFNLLNLYVASYRLHGTLNRKEVLATIQEIIINLVGSEEIGIFELDHRKSLLSLTASCGINTDKWQYIPLGSGIIGQAASTGMIYLASEMEGSSRTQGSAEESHLTACIPLNVDGKIIGAIAIFRLLEQKPGLEKVDHELFDLLATHAAIALYCTALHSEIGTASEKSGGA